MELVVILRDYWAKEHRPYRSLFHNHSDESLSIRDHIKKVCEDMGIVDGDELSITIKKTGNRPFDNRRIIFQKPHEYGIETDEQMKERLATATEDKEGKCVCRKDKG